MHPVGRHSGTHLVTGFAVSHNPVKWMRETKGEAVSATELLNNWFTCLQNAAERPLLKGGGEGNLFWGIACRTTMKAKYTKLIRLRFPLLVHSFVACGRTRRPHVPAN